MASKMTMIGFGNLGRDPQLKKGDTPAKSYVDFSIAVEEYTGKDSSGKAQYKTNWWSCRMFGQQAEYAAEHAKKGNTVYIEGSPSVTEKDGKTYLNLRVQSFALISRVSKSENGSEQTTSAPAAQPAAQSSNTSRGAAAVGYSAPAPAAAAASAAVAVAEEDDSDDLPF
jgi:single stranded DNA-binding protein